MFYFNNLKKLILRVRIDLVLIKIFYLKFVNKNKEEILIRYSLKI